MSIAAPQWRKVTIADNASLSGALDITQQRVIAIAQPASCEGTAFSFQGLYEGAAPTFVDLYAVTEEQGVVATAEYQIPKSATLAQIIVLSTTYYIYGPYQIKVRTGLTGAATVQTGAADIWLCCEDVEAVNS